MLGEFYLYQDPGVICMTDQTKNVWQAAVDQMLVVANVGVAKDDVTLGDAVAMLNKLIDVHVNIERFYKHEAQKDLDEQLETQVPTL